MSYDLRSPLSYDFNIFLFIENAEADSFFCFTNIMAEIRDNFIKTLDDSDLGIGKFVWIPRCLCSFQNKSVRFFIKTHLCSN